MGTNTLIPTTDTPEFSHDAVKTWRARPIAEGAGHKEPPAFAQDAAQTWQAQSGEATPLERLWEAACAHDWDTVQRLRSSCDLDSRNAQGRTLLHEAAYLNDAKMAEWLIQHGANTQARDQTGRTPLEEALHYDHWAVAVVLSSVNLPIVPKRIAVRAPA